MNITFNPRTEPQLHIAIAKALADDLQLTLKLDNTTVGTFLIDNVSYCRETIDVSLKATE